VNATFSEIFKHGIAQNLSKYYFLILIGREICVLFWYLSGFPDTKIIKNQTEKKEKNKKKKHSLLWASVARIWLVVGFRFYVVSNVSQCVLNKHDSVWRDVAESILCQTVFFLLFFLKTMSFRNWMEKKNKSKIVGLRNWNKNFLHLFKSLITFKDWEKY